jgi:GTP-binding protein
VIIVAVEAHTQLTEEDRRVAKLALKSQKPVVLVMNKADKALKLDLSHWEKSGIKQRVATSATHGDGITELLAKVTSKLPKAKKEDLSDVLTIALIGRPNVGKSYLFNTLAKKQQAIVANVAGTTRDINRVNIKLHGQDVTLLDTAGIRRSGKIGRGIEHFSVLRTLQAIEEADVCCLLMDVNELNTALDQKDCRHGQRVRQRFDHRR